MRNSRFKEMAPAEPECSAVDLSNRKSKIENRKSNAFTLFEVLVSIAIFMMLAGGIFAAVQAAFAASTQIVISQLDSERRDAFQQLMRRLFISLPAGAKVELRLRQLSGRGDVVDVYLWPVPAFLQFGANSSDGAAISAQPDGRGGFHIMLGYFRSTDTRDKRDERLGKASWLPLLPGVKTLQWRFAPTRNPVLADVWSEQSGRPGLVELTLTMNDGNHFVYQFWVPPLQRRSSASVDLDGRPGGPPPDDSPPEAREEITR